MPLLLDEAARRPLPQMYPFRQEFDRKKLTDIPAALSAEFHKEEILSAIKPGMKIAVAVGSRGIDHLPLIVKELIDFLKSLDTCPVILAAMGSHGGGSIEGQLEILHGYGITEEAMGVPVMASNDVVSIGRTSQGIDIYFDRFCHEEADLVITVNRIKLHTDFVDTIQSGLCKMLVIGLGHHIGCSSVHGCQFEELGAVIKEAATMILNQERIGFGLGILENAYDQTMMLEAIPARHFIEREEALVKIATEHMPGLPFDKIDIMIVEEIGKDISGAGFDPNILGRSPIRQEYLLPVPEIERMVLLGLSEGTHGNGIGIGCFDIVTRNVFDQLDTESMYANAIALKSLEDCKIPLIAADEEEAIRIAMASLRDADMDHLRVVRIRDTLHLGEFYVSEACLDEI